MTQVLGQISLLVDDYDRAIEYYIGILDFELIEDSILSPEKRWVVVRPKGGEEGANILLAKANKPEQLSYIGNQTGGRVFLFLYTDDFDRDYDQFVQKGVEFIQDIREEAYGKVCVFKDLYGNLWDFIQKNQS